jgi:hypothetical protein
VTLAVIPNASHALLPEQPAAVVKAIAGVGEESYDTLVVPATRP